MDQIGKILHDARVEKGYTIDDLQQITKIQKRYLTDIENGKFDDLPGAFYVRAFLKQYAATVGLDGDQLIREHRDELPLDHEDDEENEEVAAKEVKSRIARDKETNRWETLRRYLPQTIVIIVVLAIIGGIVGVSLKMRHQSQPSIPRASEVSPAPKASSKKATSKASSASKASSKPKADPQPEFKQTALSGNTQTFDVANVPAKDNQVTLSTTSNQVWASFVVNNSTQWQGVLTSAAPKTITVPNGTTSFIIQTGNVKQMQMKFNDQDVDLKPNDSTTIVRSITFSLNYVAKN